MNQNQFFSLYFYKAVVKSVYDGDTVTLDIDLGLGSWLKNQKIRLYGINTPEIRGEERESGLISKHRLSDMILGREIVIETHRDKTGKYGRWLATLWFEKENEDWININKLLVSEGLATVY